MRAPAVALLSLIVAGAAPQPVFGMTSIGTAEQDSAPEAVGYRARVARSVASRIVACTICVYGCKSPSDAGVAGKPVVLRVGTSVGLAPFDPTTPTAGATAAAIELVYEVFSSHAEIVESDGTTVRLRLRPESPLSAEELADLLKSPGLVSARASGEVEVVASFSDEPSRLLFETVGAVDVGPFEVERQSPTEVRLRRRGKSAIDAIEIATMSAEEEWRRLYGRQLDVIPQAEERWREEFAALDSVRIVELEPTSEVALWLNSRPGVLEDPLARRRIVRALDRAAIARVVCGSERCASRPPLPPDPGTVELPERVVIAAHRDYVEGVSAAKLVRQQLRDIGVEAEVVESDLVANLGAVIDVECELVVAPLPLTEFRYQKFVSPNGTPIVSISGYANEEYDEAVARRDFTAAREILHRDVPVTPLFVTRQFAVVDKKFCGDVEPKPFSWRWLADLRPCRKGETP